MFVFKKCTRDYVPSFFLIFIIIDSFGAEKVRLEGQMEFFGLILSLLIIQSKSHSHRWIRLSLYLMSQSM